MLAALGLPAPAPAQSSVGGEVAVGSQLVDRGLAVTAARPVVQASLAWTTPGGWSLGASAGALVRSPGNIAESLFQGSRAWSVSSHWQVQGSLMYYRYTRNGNSRVYDRGEAGMAWVYRDTLTLGLSASRAVNAPDHRWRPGADIDFRWPLPWHFSLTAGAGVAQAVVTAPGYYVNGAWVRYRSAGAATYRYGHVGLAWNLGPWRVELARIANDLGDRQRRGNLDAAPWVATASWSF